MSDTERIEDYRPLHVYRTAFERAMHLFEASETWPQEERYALTAQVRRPSRSVYSNTAAAWFKLRYAGHFVCTLSDASMEAGEPLTRIDFAVACGYMPEAESTAVHRQKYRAVIGGLTKMAGRPDQWCVSPQVQEEDADYETASDRPFH